MNHNAIARLRKNVLKTLDRTYIECSPEAKIEYDLQDDVRTLIADVEDMWRLELENEAYRKQYGGLSDYEIYATEGEADE